METRDQRGGYSANTLWRILAQDESLLGELKELFEYLIAVIVKILLNDLQNILRFTLS